MHFMAPEDFVLCSEQWGTFFYPELDESNPYPSPILFLEDPN